MFSAERRAAEIRCSGASDPHATWGKARTVAYDPVFTYDADVVVTKDHSNREADLKSTLANKGFTEQFSGEARPPVTHYQLGTEAKGFYAEFLTPLTGGTHRRDGTPDETAKALREILATSRAQFDTVTDTLREAARIVPNRALDPGRMLQLCRVGLDRLFD